MTEFTINRNARPTYVLHTQFKTKPKRISWPWSDMNPGDEVLISDANLISKAQVSAHVHARQNGWKFKTLTTDEGIVVWRIK